MYNYVDETQVEEAHVVSAVWHLACSSVVLPSSE